MSSPQSTSTDGHQATVSPTVVAVVYPSNPATTEKLRQSYNKVNTWTTRVRSYFITHDGRIGLAHLLCTLICVVAQHVMGTCHHSVSDGTNDIRWNVFTPPFGAGPHTAVFFFVLSWTTFAYCVERIWVYLTTGVRLSKKRDLIVHGLMAASYFIAFAFNIWGYVLCEGASQVNASNTFAPGVCRGNSRTCIPLIAGILTSCAAACAFCAEHVLALTEVLKVRHETNGAGPSRVLP